MATFEFKLPELGEGLHEGRISKWLVKPGDVVKEDDAVAEVENDKSMVELPSPVDGKITNILVEEGTTAVVGDILITLEVEGEGNAADAPTEDVRTDAVEHAGLERPSSGSPQPAAGTSVAGKGTTQPVPPSPSSDANGHGAAQGGQSAAGDEDSLESRAHEVLATPGVRKYARENGVDIARVKGTGTNGKVTREDVEQYMSGGVTAAGAPAAAETPGAETAETAGTTAAASVPADSAADEERIPLTGIRKIIASAMAKSAYTAPHVTVMDEANVTELVKLRKELKPLAEERGSKITYLPFVVKAMVAALRKYPQLNASLDDEHDELVIKKRYHIGIATDTERGLVVPVVRDADKRSMWMIADAITDLAQRARTNKLGPAEMKGSTISITNIGSAGGMFFTPIINYPEVAILGLGRITEKPIMKDGEVTGAQMMALSLSFDHRVIDGVLGQNFMNEVKRLLENPRLLMMEV